MYFGFSVLHKAAELGHEQVVYDVLELLKSLPPTDPPLVNTVDWGRRVSDEYRLILVMQKLLNFHMVYKQKPLHINSFKLSKSIISS